MELCRSVCQLNLLVELVNLSLLQVLFAQLKFNCNEFNRMMQPTLRSCTSAIFVFLFVLRSSQIEASYDLALKQYLKNSFLPSNEVINHMTVHNDYVYVGARNRCVTFQTNVSAV